MTRNNYDFGLSEGGGLSDDDEEEKETNNFSLRNKGGKKSEPFDLSLGKGRDRLGAREEETTQRRPLRRRSRRRKERQNEQRGDRDTQEQLADVAGVAILGGVAASVTEGLF